MRHVWTLYLRDDRNDPVDVSGCASFRAAVDVDLDAGTEVMCRTLNANISHAQTADGVISIRIDTATEQFLAKTNNQKRLPAYFEVWGYDTSGVAVLYVRIDIECSAVVDPEGGEPPSPVEADSIVRKTDLEAVVARELVFEYSPDKASVHSDLQTGDKYQRIRHGANGVPSAWQLIPYGPQGAGTPGQAASVAIGTVSALEPGAAPDGGNHPPRKERLPLFRENPDPADAFRGPLSVPPESERRRRAHSLFGGRPRTAAVPVSGDNISRLQFFPGRRPPVARRRARLRAAA